MNEKTPQNSAQLGSRGRNEKSTPDFCEASEVRKGGLLWEKLVEKSFVEGRRQRRSDRDEVVFRRCVAEFTLQLQISLYEQVPLDSRSCRRGYGKFYGQIEDRHARNNSNYINRQWMEQPHIYSVASRDIFRRFSEKLSVCLEQSRTSSSSSYLSARFPFISASVFSLSLAKLSTAFILYLAELDRLLNICPQRFSYGHFPVPFTQAPPSLPYGQWFRGSPVN